MEAINILIQLATRLNELKTSGNEEEKMQLVQWVMAGGLESLESSLEAFLGVPRVGKYEGGPARDVPVNAKFYLVTFETKDDTFYDLGEDKGWNDLPSTARHEFLKWLASNEGRDFLRMYFYVDGTETFDIATITFEQGTDLPVITVKGKYKSTKASTAALIQAIGVSVEHYYRAGNYNFVIAALEFPDSTVEMKRG